MKRRFFAVALAVAAMIMMTGAHAETPDMNPEATAQVVQTTAEAPMSTEEPQENETAAEPGDGAEADPIAEQTAESTAVEAPAEAMEGSLRQMIPWIIAGVASAAAVVNGFFAVKSRRTVPQPAAEPAKTEDSEADEPIRVRSVGNVHHIGRRKAQQDAFGVSPLADVKLIERKGVLAVVADGMGGLQNSGEISKAMVRGALSDFAHTPDGQRKMLLSILAEANRKVDEQFSGLGSIGTTFIAASVKDGMLDFISVGDSRIALVRGGAVIALNRAHNFAAELETAAARNDGNLTSAESDPRRAALTSYLGMRSLQKVDLPVEPIRLLHGDKIVLMTDGIFGTVDNETIARTLENGAADGAEQLEHAVLAEHKVNQDNLTAIILEM